MDAKGAGLGAQRRQPQYRPAQRARAPRLRQAAVAAAQAGAGARRLRKCRPRAGVLRSTSVIDGTARRGSMPHTLRGASAPVEDPPAMDGGRTSLDCARSGPEDADVDALLHELQGDGALPDLDVSADGHDLENGLEHMHVKDEPGLAAEAGSARAESAEPGDGMDEGT